MQARPGAARTHTPPRAGYAAAAGPALRRQGSITGPGHGQAARPGLSYAAVVGLATARPACVLLYSRVLHVTQDTGRYRFRESNAPRTEQQSVKFVVASSLDVRSSQLELKSSQYILIYIY